MSEREEAKALFMWILGITGPFLLILMCLGVRYQCGLWWEDKLTQWSLEEKLASDHVVQVMEEDRDKAPTDIQGQQVWPTRERLMLKSEAQKKGIPMLPEWKSMTYPVAHDPETVAQAEWWEKQYRRQQGKPGEFP